MPEEPQEDDSGLVAGMDEEGLRKTLGELLASNRAMQANFDAIREQFPIQSSNVADSIPDWSELEEGGLEPPGGGGGENGEGEGGPFAEQIEDELNFSPEIRTAMGFVLGGWNVPEKGVVKGWVNGMRLERIATDTYYIRYRRKEKKRPDDTFGPGFVGIFPQSDGTVTWGWSTINEDDDGTGVVVVLFRSVVTGEPSGPGGLFQVMLVL